MNYVIEYNGCYVRVLKHRTWLNGKEETLIMGIEHGLWLSQKPDFYNNEEDARKILKSILKQKESLECKNLNPLGYFDGDEIDYSKLKLKKIYLLDADKDDEKQMREMFDTVLDKDLEKAMLEFLDKYEKEFQEYKNIEDSSYYRGARDMLEAIISNRYENNLSIKKSNKHYIWKLFD